MTDISALIMICAVGSAFVMMGFIVGSLGAECEYDRGYDEGIEDTLKCLPEEYIEQILSDLDEEGK